MTLDEALKWYKWALRQRKEVSNLKLKDMLKLGLEALQVEKSLRETVDKYQYHRLPSETAE